MPRINKDEDGSDSSSDEQNKCWWRVRTRFASTLNDNDEDGDEVNFCEVDSDDGNENY